MKKWFLIIAVLFLAVAVATPTMALDFKSSGQYRVRGHYNSNYGLADSDASDAYFTMRFRMRNDIIVSDNLSLITRFDALDGKLYGEDDHDNGDKKNIDWDRTFMNIRTEYGIFRAGRMGGGTWGTSFNDTEGERDRLRWHDSFGDTTLYAIYEKIVEDDKGNKVSDQDQDIYYLGVTHKMENMSMGLLYGYVNDKSNATIDNVYSLFIPYFTGQWGAFGLQTELRYNGIGKKEYDDGRPDEDYKQYAYNLEGNYVYDMWKFELGWVSVSGQEKDEPGEDIKGYAKGIGDDWEKIWILTNSSDDGSIGLGGVGNFSASGKSARFGVDLFYLSAGVSPMEDLDLKFLVATGKVKEPPVKKLNPAERSDDKVGTEFDLFLDYKIYDNLTYSAVFAYLSAGDFWKDAGGVEDDKNNFHIMHTLKLSF